MPQINFFTEARMTEFWGYVKMLLTTASPAILMDVALIAVGMVIAIIVNAWKKASRENNSDDENDDYEVKHY